MTYSEEQANAAKDRHAALIEHSNLLIGRARSIYYSLIVGNITAMIAVTSTRDIDFFSSQRSIKLPVVSFEVDTVFFFCVAPALLLSTYIYQQHYFARLLRSFHGGALSNKRPYGVPLEHLLKPWVISEYFMSSANKSSQSWRDRYSVGNVLFGVSFAVSIVLTPLTLCFFWLYSFPPHNPYLSAFVQTLFCISLGLSAWICTIVFHWIRGKEWSFIAGTLVFLAFSLPASIITFDRAVGTWNGVRTQIILPLYSADLIGAQLTTQPANWESRDAALSKFLAANYSVSDPDKIVTCLKSSINLAVECYKDGVTEAALKKFSTQREVYLRFLPKIDIEDKDLRGARMAGAFMPGVQASRADFRGADLSGAVMEGGTFVNSMFGHANLSYADMNNSDISKARIDGARIPGANFQDLRSNSLFEPKLQYPRFFQCAFGDSQTAINTKNNKFPPVRPSHWLPTELIQNDIEEEFKNWRRRLNAYLNRVDSNSAIPVELQDFSRRPSECKRPQSKLVPMYQIPTWVIWILEKLKL